MLICCQSYQLSNTTLNPVSSNKERLDLPSTKVHTAITPNFAVVNLKINGHNAESVICSEKFSCFL